MNAPLLGEETGNQLCVEPEESGQKLLQFLARRLNSPQSVLHRWVRTGQVRRNGKRTQPFARLQTGDMVRLPPFALADMEPSPPDSADNDQVPRPSILLQTPELFLCYKPAGLPVHGGTGHSDSLTTRLHAHCAEGSRFLPTPAHRLDMQTSGLLLVARTYSALRLLHEAMVARDALEKTYLAWASGLCPWSMPTLLEDGVIKEMMNDGLERVRLVPLEESGKKASLTIRTLEIRNGASLVRLTLHTGRTHQIRAQLAGRGFPLLGDRKYGGPLCPQGMLLHAAQLRFSPVLVQALGLPKNTFFCPPPWETPWAVDFME